MTDNNDDYERDLDDLIEEAGWLVGVKPNERMTEIVTNVVMQLIFIAPELELRRITDDIIMRYRKPSTQGDLFALSLHECLCASDYLKRFAEQDFQLRDKYLEYMALKNEGTRQDLLKEYGSLAVARANRKSQKPERA